MIKFFVLSFLIFLNAVLGHEGSQKCGVPKSGGKIVGGVDSGAYHYPWFALLLLKRNSFLPTPICAGSLITKDHVLTAAHCFTIDPNVPNKNLFSVALGVYNICDDREASRETFDVSDVMVHEKYQKRGKFYDIAIVKLGRPAVYVTICLPPFGLPDITQAALIVGFGVVRENSDGIPCHMMEANVIKYSKSECSASSLPAEDKNEPSVICAGTPNGTVDSCYGDSGGPLQLKNADGTYTIIGIVSYGYGCGTPSIPGIYTNIVSYLNWIKDKTSHPGSTNPKRRMSQKNGPHSPRRIDFSRKPESTISVPKQMNKTEKGIPESSKVRFNLMDKSPRTQVGRSERPVHDEQQQQERIPKKPKVSFPND